jgi:uncharacterized membrane protein
VLLDCYILCMCMLQCIYDYFRGSREAEKIGNFFKKNLMFLGIEEHKGLIFLGSLRNVSSVMLFMFLNMTSHP